MHIYTYCYARKIRICLSSFNTVAGSPDDTHTTPEGSITWLMYFLLTHFPFHPVAIKSSHILQLNSFSIGVRFYHEFGVLLDDIFDIRKGLWRKEG